MFENILNHHIEWPEEEESLSEAAVETILALLHMEPEQRADGAKVKAMELTKEASWSLLLLVPDFIVSVFQSFIVAPI